MTNAIDADALGRLGLAGGGSSSAAPKDRLGQEQFLELMITQLRHQDPFKPMESGEFLGQIAQFGTVSGIADVQKSLEELAGAFRGAQTLQAASLVDREVRVAAREAWLPPDGRMRASVDMPEGLDDVRIEIYDLYGQRLTTLPVGDDGSIEWDGALEDGRAEPGFYELRALGDFDGESYELEVLVAGRVESVSTGGAGGNVSLTVTGLGSVDLARVRSIG